MKVFLDASAFAKHYVAGQGADKVIALCQQAGRLIVSVICLPELISALSRLVRKKKFSKSDHRELRDDVMAYLADLDICQIASSIMDSVIFLLESQLLRAMDAIHVACALAVEPDTFVSADHRQLLAAQKAGLNIVDVSCRATVP